jgi:hypothetical protein
MTFDKGVVFCFKVTPDLNPEDAALTVKPFGPAHEDLGKAKAWVRRNVLAMPGEVIGFASVMRLGKVTPRLIDLDFGDEDGEKPEAVEPPAAAAPTATA